MKKFAEILNCIYPFLLVVILIISAPVLLMKSDLLSTGTFNQSIVNISSLYMLIVSFLYGVLIATEK